MSDLNRHGKREHSRRESSLGRYWKRYKAWVAGMSRGQRIRYRCLQAATILAILVIVVWLVLSAWIRVPDLPDFTQDADGDGTVDTTFDGAELPDVARSGQRPGVYTFLVVGRDVVSGSTDTMILFTFDTNNKSINAISLLRDTMINTSASRGAQKRLNAVYSRNRGSSDLPESERVENGMNALKQEVSKLTGVYPNFYVMVEWEAIGELVDALGGVYFDVPFDMDYDDPAQDLHIHQEAGYRKLNGEDAMEVIRFRKSNDKSISLGDVGRTEIQRDFLSAVLKKCLEPATLLKAPSLAQIFLNNVTTDLSIGNLLAFAQLAVGMDTENNVKFVSLPYTGVMYDSASLVLAKESELLELLNDGLNPYNDTIKSSDLQLMYKKSDGSYGVTNGELADPKMGRGSSSSSSSSSSSKDEETTTLDPNTSGTTEEPTGDTSQGGTLPGGDTSQGGQTGGDTSQGGTQPGGDSSQGQVGDGSETGGNTSQGGQTGGDASQGQTGDGTQTGSGQSGSEGQGGSQSGNSSSGTAQPEPNPSVSQGSETSDSDHTVAVLPQQPEPVQPAA